MPVGLVKHSGCCRVQIRQEERLTRLLKLERLPDQSRLVLLCQQPWPCGMWMIHWSRDVGDGGGQLVCRRLAATVLGITLSLPGKKACAPIDSIQASKCSPVSNVPCSLLTLPLHRCRPLLGRHIYCMSQRP